MANTSVEFPYGLKVAGLNVVNGAIAGGGPIFVQAIGTPGTTVIDWSQGNFQEINLSASIATISFINPLIGQLCRLLIVQGGSKTITWTNVTNIKWEGGSAPTLTSTANRN